MFETINPFQSVMTPVINPTRTVVDTTEVIQATKTQLEPIVDTVKDTVNTINEEVSLKDFHLTWGTDKIVSLTNGKVSKDDIKVLAFLNWLNTVKVGDNCLEKPDVLFVIKDKLSTDLGIKSTIKAAESLWNAMNIGSWATRKGVKSGYTRNKLQYEW